ncbi:hypothetical protein PR048_011878 [Dryococelus australis]|uniref:Uncharacterized protein n=1 Tax=Dryococelus australis TaxID=614101 RepID=A0ABQ9HN19_9NEOP|nr:hypothetical protein PR048_011878 [Dryococelus australis]
MSNAKCLPLLTKPWPPSNLVFTWNARSILSYLPEFLGLLARFCPLLVGISEIWLTSSSRFSVPGYVVHRADRAAAAPSGVTLLVRSDVCHYFRLLPRNLLRRLLPFTSLAWRALLRLW